MDTFGGRNVSGIIGVLYTSVAFGTLMGPSAGGFIFDHTHSYHLVIVVSIVANAVAAAVVMAGPRVTTSVADLGRWTR